MNLYNAEKRFYKLLAIVFSIATLVLIIFTLPMAETDIDKFIEISRTLLLALGAGFFGLLGFVVGGFAISSSKSVEFIQELNNSNEGSVKITEEVSNNYSTYLQTYKITVMLIILNIIATFIVFIITCIPRPFSILLFSICITIVVLAFYFAIFSTLELFALGLIPITIQGIKLNREVKQNAIRDKLGIKSQPGGTR